MAAYKTLSDDSKRASYDQDLHQQRSSAGGPQQGSWLWNPKGFDIDAPAPGSEDSTSSDERKGQTKDKQSQRRSVWSDTTPEGARPVFVDESECVMCYHCVECAPDTFEMDVDGTDRARVVRQYGDIEEDVVWAMEACPTGAISFVDHADLPILEDLVETCTFEQPHVMMRRRMHGSSWASRPALGPYELLNRYKSGAPMPQGFRARHGGGPGAKRLKGKSHDATEVAVSIEKAVRAVPESVRLRVWPDSTDLTVG